MKPVLLIGIIVLVVLVLYTLFERRKPDTHRVTSTGGPLFRGVKKDIETIDRIKREGANEEVRFEGEHE